MKITVNIDCTPEEVRDFLGLPDVKKMQEDMLREVSQRMSAGISAMDPAEALKTWDRWGSVEAGDSRSHTLNFMASLEAMGIPDFTITADTPLHAVFKRADGKRTYLAFNARPTPLEVRFSDGQRLTVAPGQLGRLAAP